MQSYNTFEKDKCDHSDSHSLNYGGNLTSTNHKMAYCISMNAHNLDIFTRPSALETEYTKELARGWQ